MLIEEIGRFYGAPIVGEPCDPYDTWKFISGTRTAPIAAAYGRVLMSLTGDDTIDGSINWDDVSVTWRYAASNPKPEDGALDLVPFEVTALSWQRPAPRQEGDIIRCDVWFGTDGNMPGTNTKILRAISSVSTRSYRALMFCSHLCNPAEMKNFGQLEVVWLMTKT